MMEKKSEDIFQIHRVRFGQRIRYLRLKTGLSQEELADACYIDRTYIGGIERGERNPSLKNIYKIAAALRVSPATFFDFDESASK